MLFRLSELTASAFCCESYPAIFAWIHPLLWNLYACGTFMHVEEPSRVQFTHDCLSSTFWSQAVQSSLHNSPFAFCLHNMSVRKFRLKAITDPRLPSFKAKWGFECKSFKILVQYSNWFYICVCVGSVCGTSNFVFWPQAICVFCSFHGPNHYLIPVVRRVKEHLERKEVTWYKP